MKKTVFLETFAKRVFGQKDDLLSANARDLRAAKGKIGAALMARLELNDAKIDSVAGMILGVRESGRPHRQGVAASLKWTRV